MEKKSVVQELKDLQAMKDAGQLNDAEYAAAKAKVLNAGKPAAAAPPPGVPRPPSTAPKPPTSAPHAAGEQIMYPCPQGVPAGSTVTVTLNGKSFPVKIPPGTKPGDSIPVTLPPGVANPMKTGGTVQFSVQPQQQPSRPQAAAASGGAPAARGVAPGASGKWKDEWFDVLADPAVAVGGFFCMPLVLAQLWERVMNEPGACQKYAVVLIALWVFFFIFCFLMTNSASISDERRKAGPQSSKTKFAISNEGMYKYLNCAPRSPLVAASTRARRRLTSRHTFAASRARISSKMTFSSF